MTHEAKNISNTSTPEVVCMINNVEISISDSDIYI